MQLVFLLIMPRSVPATKQRQSFTLINSGILTIVWRSYVQSPRERIEVRVLICCAPDSPDSPDSTGS